MESDTEANQGKVNVQEQKLQNPKSKIQKNFKFQNSKLHSAVWTPRPASSAPSDEYRSAGARELAVHAERAVEA